jgi:hypothetical protein
LAESHSQIDRGPDRRVEPQGASAGLPRVPDGDDLLGLGDRLALGLGALGVSRGSGGRAFPFLCSAVRSHGRRMDHFGSGSGE